MPIQTHPGPSLQVSIVKTMTMMAPIQIPIMMAGIRPFGIKEYRAKAFSSQNFMTLTTTTMVSLTVKIPMMTTMALLTLIKNSNVSGAKNSPHGTMTTTASSTGQMTIGMAMAEPIHKRALAQTHW